MTTVTQQEIEKSVAKVVVANGPVAKFFNSFPPVVTSILVGLIIVVLYTLTPNTDVVIGSATFNLQFLVVSVVTPCLLAAAKGLGVNMSVVEEIVEIGGIKLSGPATNEPKPAASVTYDVSTASNVVPMMMPVASTRTDKAGNRSLTVVKPARDKKLRRWFY